MAAAGLRELAGADGYVASGSNVLRGGKRVFTTRTLEGGWYEDRAAPGFGGTRPEARTEEASRQATVTGRAIPKYGAAILDAEERAAGSTRYDPSNTVLPDTLARPSGWRSTASASFRPKGDPADDDVRATGTTFRPKHHAMTADAAQLAGYRERWLNHSGGGHAQRFRTEAEDALAGPVAPRFRASMVRALPGVPKSVETLRERMVTSKGLQALVLLRRAFAAMDDNADGVLGREELAGGLSDFGVSLSVDEFNELFRFLDADRSGTVSWHELVAVLTGSLRTPAGAGTSGEAPPGHFAAASVPAPELTPARLRAVDAAWRQLLDRAGSRGTVGAWWLLEQMDAASFPDVVTGLRDAESAAVLLLEPATAPAVAALPPSAGRRARAEAARACPVGRGGFVAAHRPWSVLMRLDEDFEAAVAALWRAPATSTGDGGGAPGPLCKVLVTHEGSGRMTVEDLPMGPFFSRDDTDAIVRELRAKGIRASAVSLDF